jgi:hypothetical protein
MVGKSLEEAIVGKCNNAKDRYQVGDNLKNQQKRVLKINCEIG